MFTPLSLRGLTLRNRVVVSSCACICSDGTAGDFHLVHWEPRDGRGGPGDDRDDRRLARRALTPGCAGMYLPEHVTAWKRIVDFVHANRGRPSGFRLRTRAARARTKLLWRAWTSRSMRGTGRSSAHRPFIPLHARKPGAKEWIARHGPGKADFVRRPHAEEAGSIFWRCTWPTLFASSFISPLSNTRKMLCGRWSTGCDIPGGGGGGAQHGPRTSR